MNKTLGIVLVALLLVSMAMVVVAIPWDGVPDDPAPAQALWVDPKNTTGLNESDTFVVDVLINITDPPGAGTGLFGFQYEIFWNSTVVQVESIQYHSPWPIPPGVLIKNETGVVASGPYAYYDYHLLSLMADALQTAFTGVTSLCTYEFKVLWQPWEPEPDYCGDLDFGYTEFVDDKLTVIPVTEYDGEYRISSKVHPPHDLNVALDAPSLLELGDSSLLNATVKNWGSYNETGVELFLLVNGAVVDSVTIPELLTNSSYTLSYMWTPALVGSYNVTAYAPPVFDENIIANNLVIKMVDVFKQVVYVDPETTTAKLGDTFVVDVLINITDPPGAGTGLFGFQYTLKWSSTMLEAESIQYHSPWPVPPAYLVKNETGSLDGYDYHWLSIAAAVGQTPFTGTTSLCTYTFRAMSNGICSLDIYDTEFTDDTATLIAHTVVDGNVMIGLVRQCFSVTWKWLDEKENPVWLSANVTSSSDHPIENFSFNRSFGHISFDIVSPGSPGFCNVAIPKPVMDGAFKVLLNDTVVPSILAWNESHTFVWFSCPAGTHNVKIIGEIVTRVRGPDLLSIADVNGDGIIDIVDVVIVALRFGWEEDC